MSFEVKVQEIVKKIEEDRELRKVLESTYNLIKGKEHYLLYVLIKAFGESFDEVKQEAINELKEITNEIKEIVSEIKDKLSRVENSWIEIATSLGRLSEYGAIIGEFSGKLDIIAQNLAGSSKIGKGSSKK
ncbi:MAG: hypothetical protein ACTSRP_08215 [Candidatus Helarchaeota archaeon]